MTTTRIVYTGSEAACLITADATAETLTAEIGDEGSESADAAFGDAGVLDLSDLTVAEVISTIDGYADYSCDLLGGSSDVGAGSIDDSVGRADTAAIVGFSPDSVLEASAILTFDEVRAWAYGNPDTSLIAAADQATVERAINSATARINNYCRRRFVEEAYTIVLDGVARQDLILPNRPIQSITSVHANVNREFTDAYLLTEDDDYLAYSDEGYLYRSAGWRFGRRGIQVVATLGYATVPQDVKDACAELVLFEFQRQRSGSIGLRYRDDGTGVSGFETRLPANIREKLDPYMEARFA